MPLSTRVNDEQLRSARLDAVEQGLQSHTHSVATSTTPGFLSAEDKAKLDSIGAISQNSFANVKVGTTTIAADKGDDTLELVAGQNIELTPDAINDRVTIAVTGVAQAAHTHSGADITSKVAAAAAADSVPWAGITDKPSTFTPAAHTHAGNDITSEVANAAHATTAGNADTVDGKHAADFAAAAHGHAEATTTSAGFLSAADKVKLDSITSGAEVNQNAFSSVKIGATTIVADAVTDTLELVAGANIDLTPDATNDKVTVAVTGVAQASHTHAGGDITSKVASASSADSVPWTGITGKPSTFTPSAHSHAGSDITSVVANATNADQLDGKHAADLVLKAGDTMTGPLTLPGDPTAPLHAATKQYVDAIKQGLDVKDSVRVATTANITLSGLQTIDGVALAAGDRVLVKNQTNAAENGIWVVAAGAWTRATDADTSAKVTPGMYVFVEQGTTNADSGFVLTTDGPITLGTTTLNFVQFSGAGQIVAGTGLQKSGNTLSLTNTGVSAGTYKSVTVDAQGRVTAGANPTTLAGYGITDAVKKGGDTMTGQLKVAQSSNTPGLILEGATAGWASGLQLNNTTTTTGRKWGLYAGSDGTFNLADETAGAGRLTVNSSGTVNIAVGLTVGGTAVSLAGHTHTKANITDFAHTHVNADITDIDWSKVTNKPDPTITLAGDASGSVTLTDLNSGTLTVTVANDSHSHSDTTINSVAWSKLTGVPSPMITLNGDVTGSGTMNSLGSVTIATTVANDSHTHDTQYLKLSGGTLTGSIDLAGNDLTAKTARTKTVEVNSETTTARFILDFNETENSLDFIFAV